MALRAEAIETNPRLPEDLIVGKVFDARDRLTKAFEARVPGYLEQDIERRVPGAGMMPKDIEFKLDGVPYTDTLVRRISRSAHDYSYRVHETRIVRRGFPKKRQTVVQFDTTEVVEATGLHEIVHTEQVAASMMLDLGSRVPLIDEDAVSRMEGSLPESFRPLLANA